MKRWWMAVGLIASLAWMGMAHASEVEHKRGDFKFFVGEKPVFAEVQAIAPQWDPAAPGGDDKVWRYWLVDMQADRRPGQDVQYFDLAFEPRAASALGDAGRYQIDFNPEYQKLVLHSVQVRRNGQWNERLAPDRISLARREGEFENDIADGRVTALIVLDDVRIGDVVRYNYSVYGSNPILAGQRLDYGMLAGPAPLLDAHMRVLFPPSVETKWHAKNGAPAPDVRRTADNVDVRASRHGAAAIVDEQNYPAWYQPFATLQVAQARMWGDVVAWALPLFPAVDALPADLEARIAEWKSLPDDEARIRAALRAVQDDVRYFGIEMGSNSHKPTPPADTWTRRWGDCKDKAYLLATILRKLGIDSAPALVSTERGKRIAEFVPTGAVFNHVILRVTTKQGPLFVDPTMSQQGGDPRDTDLSRYGVALVVAPGVRAPEPIAAPRSAQNGIRAVERWQPLDTGVQLDIETTYEGNEADAARRGIAAARQDDLSRRSADFVRSRYGDVDVRVEPVVRDDRTRNAIVISESYTLKSPFSADAGARALEIYAGALEDITRLPPGLARKGPLDVGTPAQFRHEIHFALPNGWRALGTGDTQAFAAPAFAYARKVDVGAQSVDVVYDLRILAHEVPAAGTAEHLAQLRKLRETLGARLRFQAPPSRMEAQERDARLKSLLRNVMDGGTSQ